MTALQGKLAQADSQLRFGVDLAGQVSQGEATPELHEEAENSLWDALQQFFLLNQAVALPGLLRASPSSVAGTNPGNPPKPHPTPPIHPTTLLLISPPTHLTDL